MIFLCDLPVIIEAFAVVSRSDLSFIGLNSDSIAEPVLFGAAAIHGTPLASYLCSVT